MRGDALSCPVHWRTFTRNLSRHAHLTPRRTIYPDNHWSVWLCCRWAGAMTLMKDDPNYLSLRVDGFVFEVGGRPTVCLVTLVVMALLGVIVWCTTGDRLSLLLYLLLRWL